VEQLTFLKRLPEVASTQQVALDTALNLHPARLAKPMPPTTSPNPTDSHFERGPTGGQDRPGNRLWEKL
jgi:hypothetical protein